MELSNKTYDRLKNLAIFIAAFGTFYAALSGIWGFPYGDQIKDTCLALVTFILALKKVSSYYYNKPIPMDITGLQYIDSDDEEIEGVEVDE